MKRRLTQINADFRRLLEGCAMFENFFILYENLRFNTYLLKYQLIHNRVGMN